MEDFADGGAVEFIDGVEPVEVPIETFGYGTSTPEGERNMSWHACTDSIEAWKCRV